MRKAALRSALSAKAADANVWILDGFDEPRTRAAASALKAAGIGGRLLVVLDPADEGSATVDQAFRNLSSVAFSLHSSLSTYDVLVADSILFTTSALDRLSGKDQEVSS
jgi:large subunit ribosomal protein L4